MNNFLLQTDIVEIVQGIETVSQEFAGKTVLLTGGRGFLGRYFMEVFNYLNIHILNEPVRIIVLDNLITSGERGSQIPDFENIQFINHDVTKKYKCEEVSFDYVIHAAGIASPHYYRSFPLETLEVAIQGTRNMLELAQENSARFIFFSSSEIYGDPDAKFVPMKEDYRGNVSCQGPRACYDESKRVGETLCYIFNTMKGTKTNTIRPFNVFGPGMQEKDYRVLPNFASRIKSSKPLDVYGTGNQTRTFCYITDAMIGFLLVILKGKSGEAYNIGNREPEISMLELINKIEKVTNKKVDFNIIQYPDTYPADEPNRRAPDISKANLHLLYQPKVDIEEGLRRFLEWTNETYIGEQ